MHTITNPCLKSFTFYESDKKISVIFSDHDEPQVFLKNRLHLLNLLDGHKDLKKIWDLLQSQNSSLSLSDIYITLEKLKKIGALVGAHEKGVFENNWLDFSIYKIAICENKKIFKKNKNLFLILSFGIIFLSALAVPSVFYNLPVHGFLQINNSFLYAIPLLILMLSLLGIVKGLFKALLIMLATGNRPQMRFSYRFLMFDLEVSEALILIEADTINKVYQLTKTFCFIFTGALASTLIQTDIVRQIQITALLMTFTWLNPLRKSELSQAASSFFNDEELRHLIPFLRTKSLSLFAKKTKNPHLEKKLIIFSSLALLWVFSFFDFAQNLVSSNFGFWLNAFNHGNAVEKISTAFLALAVLALSVSLLYNFVKTITLNLFSLISKSIKKFLQNNKPYDTKNIDRKDLFNFLKGLSFFNNFNLTDLADLSNTINLKSFPKNTPVILEGDNGNEMFILIDGQVRVEKEAETGFKQQFAVLEKGAIFGELALIQKCRRTADVIANTDITLAIITENQFNQILANENSNAINTLLPKIMLSRYLSNSALFKNLPPEINQLFIKKGTFESYESNFNIVKQGSLDKFFYLLLDGKVAVICDNNKISELKGGDFFGEIALFKNIPRTADITTLEKCFLLKLNKDAFWEVLAENMDLTFNLETFAQSRIGNY